MKKSLVFSFLLLQSLSFSQENLNNMSEIHSKILSNRGKEQFRKSIIFKKLDRAGYSGSNQYLEYIGEIENKYESDNISFNSKIKGFSMGTNSNLISNPDVYLGVNLDYLKSKLEYDRENSKVRTYGIDYYVGKNIDNWLIIGRAGYNESKNIYNNYKYRDKNYSLGVESGYFYSINKKSILYPYVAFDWNQYTIKAHNNIKNSTEYIGSSTLGVSYTQEIKEKFLLTMSGEWIYDFTNRSDIKLNDTNYRVKSLDLGRDTGAFNIKLGYFLKPDFLIGVGYSSFLNKNYYYDMFSITLSHNF